MHWIFPIVYSSCKKKAVVSTAFLFFQYLIFLPVLVLFDKSENALKTKLNTINKQINTKDIKNVTLVCENDVLKEVLEKFGLNTPVKYKNRTHFTAKVKVNITPEFWGWLFQMDGAVKIIAPKTVLKEYATRLERARN